MSYNNIKSAYRSMYVTEDRKSEVEQHKAAIAAQPTIDVDGIRKQRQNNLGQDIHPTEEGIKNFHRWFGDSMVTEDPQGSWHKKEQLRPLVLYHGTRHDFDKFRPSGIGNVSHTFGGYETERHGIFLTPHHEFAAQFATQGEHASGQNVMPVYAKMHNYLDVSNGFDDEDIEHLAKHGVNERMMRNIHPSRVWELFDGEDGKHFTDAVKRAGYDGVRMSEDDHETGEARDVYVAFDPHQIKSAIGNTGAFSHPSKITESTMKYDQIAEAYVSMLQEMAAPNDQIKNMTFWHGTSNKESADAILRDGIKVSDVVSRSSFTPVHGANYITPHIDYAAIYAIGGNVLGTPHAERDIANPKYGEHGYLFKIHGSQLKDVQPDEDSIGELIGFNGKGPSWLHQMARQHLSDKTMRDLKDGVYHVYARSGKTLVKKMTDAQKLDLIVNHGAHVAHFGVLHPDEAYQIHRNDVKHIKKDASNIFNYAKRIK